MKKNLETYTIRALLEYAVARFGDNPAIALIGEEDERYTYAQLGKMVDAMATYLMDLSIESGDRVAILGESKPLWCVSYLATISCGAIAVPILPDFSAKEISTILKHSGAKALIVSLRSFDKVASYCQESLPILIRMDDLFIIPKEIIPTLSSQATFKTAPGLDMLRKKGDASRISSRNRKEDDLASIIYTSGTTGSSKGVMLTHKNLVTNAVACTRQFFVIRPKMIFLSILPLSHSYEFTIGFLLPLVAGAQIHYLGRSPAASIILPALKELRPHVMLSVPLLIEKIYRGSVAVQIAANKKIQKYYKKPFFRKIIHKMVGRKLVNTFGGRLKFFGIGGAALDGEVEKFLKEAKFPYAIGYGLTETSPMLAGSGPKQTKPGTVGYAVKGVSLRIDEPDAHTHVGEIVAKGDNVMKGYYENEPLTKESFTEDGWFKTGDLGILEKGRLSIKGRKKTMILGPSGENIYPEHIETYLNNLPYVQESLVLPGDGGLAAMIKLDLELMASNLKDSATDVKDEAIAYISHLRDEVNKELSAFSKIRDVSLQDEPFQRTPTMKIKRYLYSLTHTIAPKKDKEKEDNDNSTT